MAIASSPSTTLYQLGKCVISFAEFSGGAPGAYTDVGNCPAFSVEVTEEKLPHYSSRTGTKTKDKEVVIETGYTLTFDLDEVSIYNLKVYVKGTTSENKIYANQSLDREFAIRFVTDNPAGPNETWYFWRVTLSPNGPFSLIGDEWSTLSFTGEGLSDTVNHSASPYFDIYFVTTTSTTTTSSTTTTTV
jgi:hypothetical protein